MLDVTCRSQRGRVCRLTRGEHVLETPAMLPWNPDIDSCVFDNGTGRTVRICGGEIAVDPKFLTGPSSGEMSQVMSKDGISVLRLPIRGDEIIPADSEVVIVPNAYELRENFRGLVEQTVKAREVAGYGRLLVMLGVADPANAAFLFYMGVDAVDETFVRMAGDNGYHTTSEGIMYAGTDVSPANAAELKIEVSKAAVFIKAGRLRELVDQRSFATANGVAALRVFDKDYYDFQEEGFAVNAGRFSCNTVQSLRRPDVVRHEVRMAERYTPPAHKKILLLLPCSAKKPYHISRTHRMFASAVHTGPWDTLVHEVIVTSPLGVVPRELDAFYPASSYDIPVTGEWKPEEKDRIVRMLRDLVSKGNYERVISHLGEDDELVRDVCPGMVSTSVGDSVSPASLSKLETAIREMTKEYKALDWNSDRKETVRSALAYQFGPEAADALLEGRTTAMGKYPYWKVMREIDGKKCQLCMMSAERGMFSLGPDGARILMDMGLNLVETVDDFEVKGSLFAVGIKTADRRIREGDEAIIVHDGKFKGVGVATMCGLEMEQAKRGVAVKVRHAC